jgi:hypothetical protein
MHWSMAVSVPISCQPTNFFSLYFFFASLVIVSCPRAFPLVPISRFTAYKPPRLLRTLSLCPFTPHSSLAMIMVQKPFNHFSSPSTFHRRLPSAPPAVLVQPTHIPGLLSLSKPHPVTPPRSQQQHQNHHNRQSRSSNNRPKPTNTARPSQLTPAVAAAQPLLSEDPNKLSTPGRPTTKPHPVPVTPALTPEKPPRGRQSSKQSKDKSKPR